MAEFPKMLYKHPGPHKIHGDMFDHCVVADEDEMKVAAKDGWCETTTAALKGEKPKRKYTKKAKPADDATEEAAEE